MATRKRKFSIGFDHMVAILTIPIALFLIVVAYRAPRPNIPQTIGPEFLPITVLSLICVCAIFIFIDSTGERQEAPPPSDVPAPHPASEGYKKYTTMVLIILVLGLYAAVLETVGFVISTTLLVLLSARLFQKGKWVRNVIVSLLFSVAVYYCFVRLLEVQLPAGILPL